MRKFVLAALMLGAAHSAHAADMPDFSPVLRGAFPEGLSSTRVVWQGYYVGGQAGYGTADINFNKKTSDLAGQLLSGTNFESEQNVSQWSLLGKSSQHGSGFGGFAGYNSQWDDVVIGVELSYLHGKFGGSQTDSMSRVFGTSNGYTNSVTYDAAAQLAITDMATLRARAAYAYGNFLPYLFGGVALGQGTLTRSVNIYGTQVNAAAAPGFTNVPFNLSAAENRNSRLLVGYSAGVGVDVMLAAGIFLRAEWEYLRFASQVDTSINTVRAGVGYKF